MLARVSSLTLFPAYGIGVISNSIDGPLASAFGPAPSSAPAPLTACSAAKPC